MKAHQLKNAILQLAVQGKLVPQNPNDEPASVLLERIRAEKERLIKEKKIKREKNPSVIFKGADNTPYEKIGDDVRSLADEVPFDIPDSWEWVRLKNFCIDIFSGKSPKYVKRESNYHIIGQAANQNDGLDFSKCKYTNVDFWNSMSEKYFIKKYDVLLNTLGNGTLGRSGIVLNLPYAVLTDGHLFVLRTGDKILSWYLYLYLQYRKTDIERTANGSTNQTFLSLTKTMEWLIPIPPLAEQRRIVDRLESLLPLVEAYGKAEAELSELDARFPDMLKKSILQDAVQGKLVPQNPNDEPASVLLERIRAEKQRLIKEGKIKKDKHESVIFRRDNSHYENLDGVERCIDDELPFDIPSTWMWSRLSSIVTVLGDGIHGTPVYSANGTTAFINGNNLQNGKIVIKPDTKRVTDEEASRHKRCLTKDTVLLSINGTIGNVAFYDGEHVILGKSACYFNLLSGVSKEYVRLVLETDYFAKYAVSVATGTTIKNVPLAGMRNLLVPIPPLAEQRRIVQRIEDLLPLIKGL